MTVRGWSLLAAGSVLAAWLLAGVLQWWQYHQAMSDQARFITTWAPATSHASRLGLNQANTTAALDRAVISGYVRRPERLEGLLVQMAQSTTELRSLLADEGTLRGLLEQADSSQQEWLSTILDPTLEAMAHGRTDAAAAITASGTNERLTEAMQQDSAFLHSQVHIVSLMQSRAMVTSARNLSGALIIAMALILTAIVTVAIGIRLQVLRPILRLRAALREVASDPGHGSPIATVGPEEIASVARDAEGLRRRLLDEILDARAANEALGTHAPLVAEVRERLHGLPPPHLDDMEIFTSTRPAAGVIGGDWWQFVRRADGIWCLVLADVSGHGWESGVMALQIRAVLDAFLCCEVPLVSVPPAACRLLQSGEHTISMVLMELDAQGNEIRYLNAGHPPPVLLRPDQVRGRPSWHGLGCTGPLLSCLTSASTSWTTQALTWNPGDVLIAYSDGLLVEGESVWTAGSDWLDLVARRAAGDRHCNARELGNRLLAQDHVQQAPHDRTSATSTTASDDASLIVIARDAPG